MKSLAELKRTPRLLIVREGPDGGWAEAHLASSQNNPRTITLGSLFDGSGGFPLAGAIAGVFPLWAAEIEPYPIAVTREHFPKMQHLGNVAEIKGGNIPPVDIITFGSPCQDMSIAGKRAGMQHAAKGDDETTRSGLFYEAVRIIKEMRGATNGKYPRYAVWENVPGAFSSNKGEDFRCVLQELIQVVAGGVSIPQPPKGKWYSAGEIVGDGFSLAWRVLDAQYWGVPQRRKRIYLVADFGGERAGKILFERNGLSGHPQPGQAARERTADDAAGSAGRSDRVECVTTAAFMGGQGYKAGGIGYSENVAPTIKSALSGGNTVPDVVYALQGNGIDRAETAGCNGKGWRENECYTLNTIDRPAVVYDARGNGDGETVPTLTGDHENRVTDYTALCVEHAKPPREYIVRRITPLECCRLQGFPDGWGDTAKKDGFSEEEYRFWLTVRQTKESINGKEPKHYTIAQMLAWYNKLHTDSAEYKMWGNGIALPCAVFVLGGVCHELQSCGRCARG